MRLYKPKSLVLAVLVFVVAFISYFTFPLFLGEPISGVRESFGFTFYNGLIDAVAVYIVSYIMFD